MSVTVPPTRSAPRYGDRVGSRWMAVEGDNEAVHALAARLVRGDETALEEVYDRWSALVHTFALRSLRDTHDAEDVTQAVFVAAWRSRHTLKPSPSALPSWLIGIARHKVGDVRAARARDAGRVTAVASLPDAPGAAADKSAEEGLAERLVVRQAVDELPDPRRTILFLAFWEGHSHTEIAELVGLPLGTVKSHVRRGLIQLHQTLQGVRHDAR